MTRLHTLPDVIDAAAARFPDRVALVWDDELITYGQMGKQAAHVAGGLQALGLRAGDRVLSVNGTPTPDGDTLRAAITGSKGVPLALVVRRDGARVTLRPVEAVLIDGAYRVGIGLDEKGYPAGEAAWRAVKALGFVTRDTGKSLGNLVHQQGRDQVSSPVGIVRESARAASAGWEQYLTLLAFISLSLGLLNLLPLLPLDGGHIAVATYEKIRNMLRSLRGLAAAAPVNYLKLMPATYVVIALMAGYMLLTVTADLVNPIRLFQ